MKTFFIPYELAERCEYVRKGNRIGLWSKNRLKTYWWSNVRHAIDRYGWYADRRFVPDYFRNTIEQTAADAC